MKISALIILAILIGGCTSLTAPVSQRSMPQLQCDQEMQYCINFSAGMGERIWTDNWTGLGGLPTDHTVSNGLPPDAAEYVRADLYRISQCSPSTLGASSAQSLTDANGTTTWGKVDYYDIYWTGDFPHEFDPNLCKPLSSEGVAYALCSEKDGKRVLICISQMTDNPKLAEEIFRTFRWEK